MRMTPRGTMVAMVMATMMATGTVVAQAQTPAVQGPAAPTVTVGGVVYAQYNYQLSGFDHLNSFDATRAYINVNAKFAGGVSARIARLLVLSEGAWR